uniref:Gag protein n=1 Tax=Globodera rostochiensis TaxID=31243 RepID=A0A914H6B7_GLORO
WIDRKVNRKNCDLPNVFESKVYARALALLGKIDEHLVKQQNSEFTTTVQYNQWKTNMLYKITTELPYLDALKHLISVEKGLLKVENLTMVSTVADLSLRLVNVVGAAVFGDLDRAESRKKRDSTFTCILKSISIAYERKREPLLKISEMIMTDATKLRLYCLISVSEVYPSTVVLSDLRVRAQHCNNIVHAEQLNQSTAIKRLNKSTNQQHKASLQQQIQAAHQGPNRQRRQSNLGQRVQAAQPVLKAAPTPNKLLNNKFKQYNEQALEHQVQAVQQATQPATQQCRGQSSKNWERHSRFETQLEKAQQEAKHLEIFMDDIREASSAWADLLRKLQAADRETGDAEFSAFNKKEKINDKTEEASTKLQDLRDLIGTLTVQARIYRSRADKEERDAQSSHAQALQQNATAPTRNNAPAFTAPLYQFQPIQVERFSGQKRQWPEFYESFKSAIGRQPISKAEKFNLLRNMLGGEARQLVSGFRLEDQNYDVVLQLLKDTYGAPEEHIRALHFELANLKACKSLRDTQEFLLQLERLTRELNNAGEDFEGPPTFLMLEKKLTPAFLRTILNKKGEDPAQWSTTKFRNVLNEAVRKETQIQEVMREYGHQQHQQSAQTNNQSTHAQPQRAHNEAATSRTPEQPDRTVVSATVDETRQWHNERPPQRPCQPIRQQTTQQEQLRASERSQHSSPSETGNNQREPPYPCIFCGSNHWHEECQQFNTLQQRLDIIRAKQLCFKCLKPNHRAYACSRPNKCYRCKRRHPTALCRDRLNESAQDTTATNERNN